MISEEFVGFGRKFETFSNHRRFMLQSITNCFDLAFLVSAYNMDPLRCISGFGNVLYSLRTLRNSNAIPERLICCGSGWRTQEAYMPNCQTFRKIMMESLRSHIPLCVGHKPFHKQGEMHYYVIHSYCQGQDNVIAFDRDRIDFNEYRKHSVWVEIPCQAYERLLNKGHPLQVARILPRGSGSVTDQYKKSLRWSLEEMRGEGGLQEIRELVSRLGTIHARQEGPWVFDERDVADAKLLFAQHLNLYYFFALNSDVFPWALAENAFVQAQIFRKMQCIAASDHVPYAKIAEIVSNSRGHPGADEVVGREERLLEMWKDAVEQLQPNCSFDNEERVRDVTLRVPFSVKANRTVRNVETARSLNAQQWANFRIPLDFMDDKEIGFDFFSHGIPRADVEAYRSSLFRLTYTETHLLCMVPDGQQIPVDGTKLHILGGSTMAFGIGRYEILRNGRWEEGYYGLSDWYSTAYHGERLEMRIKPDRQRNPSIVRSRYLWGTWINVAGAEKVRFETDPFKRIVALSVES